MSLKQVLLTASAALALGLGVGAPAFAADPPGGYGAGRDGDQGRHDQWRGGQGQRGQRQGSWGQGHGQGNGQGQGRNWGRDWQGAQQGGAGPYARGYPQQGTLGDWDRRVVGEDRDRSANEWRNRHQGWDGNASWHRSLNWWRGHPGFRNYYGPRFHFFFIPGYGYISPPLDYWGRHWRVGEYLPPWFWRYEVRDYWLYGLPTPPPGCAWVWVDHDVALVDMSDGYIIDIVYGVW
jgi:Ni/Co efflux regulator RcnB